MYHFLTGDACQETQGSAIDNHLEMFCWHHSWQKRSKCWKGWRVHCLLDWVGQGFRGIWEGCGWPTSRPWCGTYAYIAISVPDLIQQVSQRLPPETAIPSNSWVRFQFWAKNRFSETAKRYKCHFDLTYKIQRRQLRKTRVDSRYCAVHLRYLKEMAVMFWDHCTGFSWWQKQNTSW